MDLGTKLQQFRKSNGLSLRELSSLTNLSISFLSDIEHNRSYPSILTLKVISEKLSVPISILLDDEAYSPDYKSLNLSDILLLLDDFSSWKRTYGRFCGHDPGRLCWLSDLHGFRASGLQKSAEHVHAGNLRRHDRLYLLCGNGFCSDVCG